MDNRQERVEELRQWCEAHKNDPFAKIPLERWLVSYILETYNTIERIRQLLPPAKKSPRVCEQCRAENTLEYIDPPIARCLRCGWVVTLALDVELPSSTPPPTPRPHLRPLSDFVCPRCSVNLPNPLDYPMIKCANCGWTDTI